MTSLISTSGLTNFSIITLINISLSQSHASLGHHSLYNTLSLNGFSVTSSYFFSSSPTSRINFSGYTRKESLYTTADIHSVSTSGARSLTRLFLPSARLSSSQASISQTLGDYDIDLDEIREMLHIW